MRSNYRSRPARRIRREHVTVGSRWVNVTAKHHGLMVTVVRLTPNSVMIRPAGRMRRAWSLSQIENTWTIRYEQFFNAYRPC